MYRDQQLSKILSGAGSEESRPIKPRRGEGDVTC
jgi:hypothetical protein